MQRKFRGLIALSLILVGLGAPSVHASNPANDGLVSIGTGAAAFYDPSYDYGGWDRIRRIQAANYGLSPDQVYDADGWYCVVIGYYPGNIITIRNENTGATGTCMIADTNAPQDNAVWRSRWVVEMSYRAFVGLGLDQGNYVSVWVMPATS